MLNDKIPYSDQMLASVTRHTIGNIRQALDIFQNLGLVEVLQNGAIFMTDIQTLIGRSSSEGDRKREYRAKISREKKSLNRPKKGISRIKDVLGQMSDKNPPKKEIELKENEQEKYEKLNDYLLNLQIAKDKANIRLQDLTDQDEIEF